MLAADVQIVMKHVTQFSSFNIPGLPLHVRASEVGLAKGKVEELPCGRFQETGSVSCYALHHTIHFACHIVEYLLARVPHRSIFRHKCIHGTWHE